MVRVVRLAEIRETPLDVVEVLAAVEDDAAGGVAVFVGRVRDEDGGRGVRGLAYHAHPSAADRLREICEKVAADHRVPALAAVHRTGELAVGDIAVVVATAAGHRGDTFAATRDLIDTLKAEVPIWKHQLFTDGTDEWVGAP
ncbi:MAG: molybdenum cofactor biosynthesis protein MoaE [Nocardioides sp.]|uniref:molybdenum cofactor biosynthesis protein MoaE n=1 Tax=Nocardioides sp. TaxID=35761 RepID=UPI0039E2EDC1